MGRNPTWNCYRSICLCCSRRSCAWSDSRRGGRSKSSQMALDGIPHGHYDDVHSRPRHSHSWRELSSQTLGLQSLESPIPNWKLGFACQVRRVGRINQRNGHLVRCSAFSNASNPICFCVALYASYVNQSAMVANSIFLWNWHKNRFVYGILYANLAAFSVEFQDERGWNLLIGALPFPALFIGILLGGAVNVFNQSYYNSCLKANGNKPVPEARLPPIVRIPYPPRAAIWLYLWRKS